MVVGRRSGQGEFTARELQLLEDLARQVAREVRMARLADDLQQSRERLVRAREEERVRVRRDLHDGIGPTLAAATLQVDVLRDRWQDDDPRVGQLLDKVKAGLVSSVDDLRPPALDELGLAGVLREHASSLQDAGLSVVVHTPPTLEVRSAAAEVAAYRIVTESLTNVVRHARATRVEVSLDLSDDGVGPGDATAPGGGRGVGVRSMRERASELGGSLTIAADGLDGRGTVVTARLPVGGEP